MSNKPKPKVGQTITLGRPNVAPSNSLKPSTPKPPKDKKQTK